MERTGVQAQQAYAVAHKSSSRGRDPMPSRKCMHHPLVGSRLVAVHIYNEYIFGFVFFELEFLYVVLDVLV